MLPTLAIVVLSLLDLMFTVSSSGGVVSILKVLTVRLSLTTPLDVTLILQLLYVLSGSALKVTVLLLSLIHISEPTRPY